MGRGGPSAHCSRLPQESQDLFCCLYRSWCHNPVTTVSLCFLTQNYRHAYDLIQKLYPSLSRFFRSSRWRGGPTAILLPPARDIRTQWVP